MPLFTQGLATSKHSTSAALFIRPPPGPLLPGTTFFRWETLPPIAAAAAVVVRNNLLPCPRPPVVCAVLQAPERGQAFGSTPSPAEAAAARKKEKATSVPKDPVASLAQLACPSPLLPWCCPCLIDHSQSTANQGLEPTPETRDLITGLFLKSSTYCTFVPLLQPGSQLACLSNTTTTTPPPPPNNNQRFFTAWLPQTIPFFGLSRGSL